MSALAATATPSSRPPAALRAAQILLGLMGVVVMWGSIYFSAIAPPVEVDALGWAVGAWAFAMAVGFVLVAVRLGRDTAEVRRLATRLLILHVAFGLVKVVGYDEPEAGVFIAVDLALIGLLRRAPSRPAAREAAR